MKNARLTRRAAMVGLLASGAALAVVPSALAGKARYYTGLVRGTAIGGYDPVSYFTESKAVRGKKEFEAEWDNVKWRFSSAENRDAFLASPQKFAPKYGGYCAYAVANGTTAKGDPRHWKIVNEKLYLNYNRSIKRTWENKQSYYIKAGNKKWPGLTN